MRDEPRFVNLRRVEGLDNGSATDLANALDDPYNVIKERKSGEYYIAWDNELDDSPDMFGEDGQSSHYPADDAEEVSEE